MLLVCRSHQQNHEHCDLIILVHRRTLQGLLGKLGAGFDDLMPSGGMSSSQLKVSTSVFTSTIPPVPSALLQRPVLELLHCTSMRLLPGPPECALGNLGGAQKCP